MKYLEKKFSLINILYTIFLILSVILILLYYYAVPIYGDDWWYTVVRHVQEIYTWSFELHPGRNISEWIHVFTSRVIGGILGEVVKDPITGLKMANSIVATIITSMLWFVSLYYVKNSGKKALLLLIFFSPHLLKLFAEFTSTSQIYGGFVLTLIAWVPFIHYIFYHKLPDYMEQNFEKSFGIWLVFVYMGTQIHDNAPWILALYTFFLFLYLSKEKNLLLKKRLLILTKTFVTFVLYAFLRNTLLTGQVGSRVGQHGLNFFHRFHPKLILGHIISYTSPLGIITMIVGMMILMIIVISIVRSRQCNKERYFVLTALMSCFASVFILSILQTNFDQAVWVIWLVIVNLLIHSYNHNKYWALLSLPTIILGLAISTLGAFSKLKFMVIYHRPLTRMEFISTRINERILEQYQKADQKGLDHLPLTKEKFNSLYIVNYTAFTDNMSLYYFKKNYTSRLLPIVIVPDK
ncbi:MAG: hypothetical protein ACRCTJ_04225 [Brevinema sp.]